MPLRKSRSNLIFRTAASLLMICAGTWALYAVSPRVAVALGIIAIILLPVAIWIGSKKDSIDGGGYRAPDN